ncbi:aspartate/glutamate racemase family protein [Parasphingopyxis algicola]|uniref:aspartate/glutamate racemase family protein n=1 Tax=Parasphingopyxis algicola TaxID=2026624 RepID=UPI001FEB1642|nr:aspartate/glutamate racemase family protein [Parasphingopyxis algicola]
MTATIHIITPVITEGIRSLDDVAPLAGKDLHFTHSLLEKGPSSIESEVDEALAVPGIMQAALAAEESGADAVIIDCMGDPGLKAARELVRIPVLGPAETSMHLAAMLGHKFSIVTVLDSVRPLLDDLARVYAVHDKLASIRVINIPVLEIEQRIAEVQDCLAEIALAAVEQDGADVIVLGCTGFLGCADAITERLESRGYSVPVIDPVPATVCVAQALVKAGLTHSSKTYPKPGPKSMAGLATFQG